MDASQFALWLQGFAELNTAPPTPEQWQSIREHLQLVFKKVTPELKKPVIDVTGNKDMQRLIENARKDQGYQPWPLNPIPSYWLDRHCTGKPGESYC